MTKIILTLLLSLTAVQNAQAIGQENEGASAPMKICGALYGYCGNGWCNKFIKTSAEDSVKIDAASPEVLSALNALLNKSEGTPVCAMGSTENGVFEVTSVTAE